MLFEDDVVVVVVEQDGYGAELRWGAAGLRDLIRLQEVDLPEQWETSLKYSAFLYSIIINNYIWQNSSMYRDVIDPKLENMLLAANRKA